MKAIRYFVALVTLTCILFAKSAHAADPPKGRPWGIIPGETYVVPGCKLTPQAKEAVKCFLQTGSLENFTLNWNADNEV